MDESAYLSPTTGACRPGPSPTRGGGPYDQLILPGHHNDSGLVVCAPRGLLTDARHLTPAIGHNVEHPFRSLLFPWDFETRDLDGSGPDARPLSPCTMPTTAL